MTSGGLVKSIRSSLRHRAGWFMQHAKACVMQIVQGGSCKCEQRRLMQGEATRPTKIVRASPVMLIHSLKSLTCLLAVAVRVAVRVGVVLGRGRMVVVLLGVVVLGLVVLGRGRRVVVVLGLVVHWRWRRLVLGRRRRLLVLGWRRRLLVLRFLVHLLLVLPLVKQIPSRVGAVGDRRERDEREKRDGERALAHNRHRHGCVFACVGALALILKRESGVQGAGVRRRRARANVLA